MKPDRKRLLLVGGGHAHLFVLETLRQLPADDRARLDITLLTRDVLTPYSGMLPGLIAGHYRPSECHVDLTSLCQAAGVALVQAGIVQLDLVQNRVCSASDCWSFDLVSLDIGSSPPLQRIPGALQFGLPVKPIEAFLQQWRQFQQAVEQLTRPVHVVVVGGGAGGVEVLLAMAHRLQAHRGRVKWSLVSRGELLPGAPRRAARLAAAHLAAAGVALRTDCEIARVEASRLFFSDGSEAACDQIIWATGSAPQPWPATSGLQCADDGCVSINGFLQSTSHPQVFAAGDVATDANQPRPKAGVFAVRQGPILAANLLRYASGRALLPYRAQRDYLSLLSTGQRHAIASWYGLVWQGNWVWQIKNRIDRRFMQRFSSPFAVAPETPSRNR